MFDEAKRAILASPKLRHRFTILNNVIVHRASQSKYEVLSGIAANADGKNIHGCLFDELHRQKSRDLFDTLTYGGAAREQSLMVSLTTAGHDRKSICYEQVEYARKVNEGTILDTCFFGFIAEASPEDDWTSPKTWKKANPSMGVTISEADLARRCKEAQDSPSKENAFKRFRLNLWTEQETKWLSAAQWQACERKKFDWESLEHQQCWAGLDLGIQNDISALVLLFKTEDGYAVKPFMWCCEETINGKREPWYQQWKKAGLIKMTDGNAVSYEQIKADIIDIAQEYQIEKLAIDPMNASQLAQDLVNEGIEVEFFRQNFGRMNEPTQALERMILRQEIFHDGNKCMEWQFGNIVIDSDPYMNIRINKKKSSDKVDAWISLVMSVGLAIADDGGSAFN